MSTSTIHEAEEGVYHDGEYASCPECHGGEPCVEAKRLGCTGYFFSDLATVDPYTGWTFADDERDVPMHDCRTEDS